MPILDKNGLIQLARANAKSYLDPQYKLNFSKEILSADAINGTFMQQLNELGRDPHDFELNKHLIFRLMEEGLTEVIPPKVLQSYGQFADIQHFGQGDRPVFKVRISEASKKRAKQFVTKVGLAGRYETFKLDGYTIEVPTSAFGGAARIEWEELLDQRFTMSDYYSLVLEGLDEAIYKEIARELKQTVTAIKPINKTSQTQFDEREMDRLLMIADTYGQATIYCTFEFAVTMLPAEGWRYSDNMKDALWKNGAAGAITSYKGHNVVILPQSFEDETNTKKVIDPSLAYIIPTGSEKPIKVAFEGSAQVKSFDNRDWSTELQTYTKVGVASYLVNPGICVYENTSLDMNVPMNGSAIKLPTFNVKVVE